MAIQDKDIKKFKLDMDKSRLYIRRENTIGKFSCLGYFLKLTPSIP